MTLFVLFPKPKKALIYARHSAGSLLLNLYLELFHVYPAPCKTLSTWGQWKLAASILDCIPFTWGRSRNHKSVWNKKHTYTVSLFPRSPSKRPPQAASNTSFQPSSQSSLQFPLLSLRFKLATPFVRGSRSSLPGSVSTGPAASHAPSARSAAIAEVTSASEAAKKNIYRSGMTGSGLVGRRCFFLTCCNAMQYTTIFATI